MISNSALNKKTGLPLAKIFVLTWCDVSIRELLTMRLKSLRPMLACYDWQNNPDSKVHGANMGPTWVLSAPGGPHVGPVNLAIKDRIGSSDGSLPNMWQPWLDPMMTPISQTTQAPDSEVHGANMGPILGRQGPGGPHGGPMNFVVLGSTCSWMIGHDAPQPVHCLKQKYDKNQSIRLTAKYQDTCIIAYWGNTVGIEYMWKIMQVAFHI